jgi:hypothetical protein
MERLRRQQRMERRLKEMKVVLPKPRHHLPSILSPLTCC